MPFRASLAHATADALESASRSGSLPSAFIGFDGFIDAIIDVVDSRRDMSDSGYDRIQTIDQFANRVAGAAGKSTNLEMVVKEERFGGNGPLMAGALGRLGSLVSYIGAVGHADNPRTLHPLYRELSQRCARVEPVAPPAHTDALEFEDGKVMLGRPAPIQSITWDSLKEALGLRAIISLIAGAELVGMVNWVMMRGVESIWQGLIEEVLPQTLRTYGRPRHIFIDLCDPAKRTDQDIQRALRLLARLNTLVPVTLGLNQAEAERLAGVIGRGEAGIASSTALGPATQHLAVGLRRVTTLACVVIHPREGAAAATASDAAWFDGPFTPAPRLSTGAGDHFNAAFALARSLNMPLDQCLAAACAESGAYVRDAESPTMDRLLGFLRELAHTNDR